MAMADAEELARIELARRGDAQALTALWRQHRGWVAAVLLVHRPPGSELEDLLQDVAVTLIASIRSLEAPAALRSWLRTVAINTARSAGRRADARPRPHPLHVVDDDVVDPACARDVAADAAKARVEAVLATVAKLPIELREALVLRAVHGMSQRSVAEVLGVPETTVETRLARARRLLRRNDAETSASRRAR